MPNEFRKDSVLISDADIADMLGMSRSWVRKERLNRRRGHPHHTSYLKGIGKPPAISLSFKIVEVGKQQTVVLVGENDADPKLLGIANSLSVRVALDGLREALEPHLTGKTEPARYKSFQRLRDKLLETGLIVLEGSEYLRST